MTGATSVSMGGPRADIATRAKQRRRYSVPAVTNGVDVLRWKKGAGGSPLFNFNTGMVRASFDRAGGGRRGKPPAALGNSPGADGNGPGYAGGISSGAGSTRGAGGLVIAGGAARE